MSCDDLHVQIHSKLCSLSFFPLLYRTQFYSLVHKERGEYSRGKESINGTSGMDLVIVNPPVGNTIEKGYFLFTV